MLLYAGSLSKLILYIGEITYSKFICLKMFLIMLFQAIVDL